MLRIKCEAEDIRKLLEPTVLLERIALFEKNLDEKVQLCKVYEQEIDNMHAQYEALFGDYAFLKDTREIDLRLIDSHEITMQAQGQKIEKLLDDQLTNERFIKTIMDEHDIDRDLIESYMRNFGEKDAKIDELQQSLVENEELISALYEKLNVQDEKMDRLELQLDNCKTSIMHHGIGGSTDMTDLIVAVLDGDKEQVIRLVQRIMGTNDIEATSIVDDACM